MQSFLDPKVAMPSECLILDPVILSSAYYAPILCSAYYAPILCSQSDISGSDALSSLQDWGRKLGKLLSRKPGKNIPEGDLLIVGNKTSPIITLHPKHPKGDLLIVGPVGNTTSPIITLQKTRKYISHVGHIHRSLDKC